MSEPERSLLQRAAVHVGDFFEFVGDALESESARRAILADLGMDVSAPASAEIPADRIQSIRSYRDLQDPDFQAFLSTWGDIVAVLETLDSLIASSAGGSEEEIKEATYQLATLLGTDFMRLRHPFWFFLGQLARFFTDRPDNVEEALSGLKGEVDADTLSSATLLPLAILLAYWEKFNPLLDKIAGSGFELPDRAQLYGWDLDESSPTPVADALSQRMLSFQIEGKETDPASEGGGSVAGKLGITLAWVPEEHGGPGLFVLQHGNGEMTAPLGANWRLKVKFASSGAVDFLIRDGVEVNGPEDASASFTIETTRKTDELGPYLLGFAKGARLELSKATITGQLGATGASIKAVSKKSSLVMEMAEADPFVERSIPAKEVRFDIDFGLGISSEKGVFLEGGSGLQLSLPLNRSVGPVRLRQLLLGLSGGPSGNAVKMDFLSTMEVKLGPITATIDRLGFAVALDAKDRNAPLIGFKGPTGIGLAVDCKPVMGGGYLFWDSDAGQYAGAVQLDLGRIALQAVGIITTRMPDGSRGYSLLVIISTDFCPINIGFGFRLTAVGGLIGLNRTADVEALRAGLKNRSLDAILFPENPVADAARIVTTLQTVMPARDGQFMGGLFGQFRWGVPTVMTIELGLILEWDDPWRLLVLGQIRILLPHEEKVLVRLQMDVLGVVDWDRDEISIDAVLYDSHILTHALTGEMALRARWGDDPCFLLAVGGFHPSFSPPAGFPALARIALTLTRGDSIRLRLEAYLALTSNTAQLGARADLLVRASSFSVEGYLGFDALFQFSPFMFVVDLRAGVTLKWHGRTLAGIDLELTVSGPSPWHARGKATFKIWRFSKSVSFDRKIGADTPPPALPAADPLPELLAALEDPRNWGAELTPLTSMVLTLRESADIDEVLIHPLGELSVRQRVVPLGITIDRFGNTTPAGDRRFDLALIPADEGDAGVAQPVLDFFAAAQFLEISDSSKLRRPSFELMEAGVRVSGELSFGGELDETLVGVAPIEYETVPPEGAPPPPAPTPLDVSRGELRQILATEAYRAPSSRTADATFRAPPLAIRVDKARYVVARKRDLEAVALADLDEGGAPSYTAAAQALWRHEQEQPEERDELQVITVFASEGAGA